MSDDLTAPGGLQGWLDLFQESAFSNLDTAAIYTSLQKRKPLLESFPSFSMGALGGLGAASWQRGQDPARQLQLPSRANALDHSLCFWLLTFRHPRPDFPLARARPRHAQVWGDSPAVPRHFLLTGRRWD